MEELVVLKRYKLPKQNIAENVMMSTRNDLETLLLLEILPLYPLQHTPGGVWIVFLLAVIVRTYLSSKITLLTRS